MAESGPEARQSIHATSSTGIFFVGSGLVLLAAIFLGFPRNGITINGQVHHDVQSLIGPTLFLFLFGLMGAFMIWSRHSYKATWNSQGLEVTGWFPGQQLEAKWGEIKSLEWNYGCTVRAVHDRALLPYSPKAGPIFQALLSHLPASAFPASDIKGGINNVHRHFNGKLVSIWDYLGTGVATLFFGTSLFTFATDSDKASPESTTMTMAILVIVLWVLWPSIRRIARGTVVSDDKGITLDNGLRRVTIEWDSMQLVGQSMRLAHDASFEVLLIVAGDDWFELSGLVIGYRKLRDLIVSRAPQSAHIYIG